MYAAKYMRTCNKHLYITLPVYNYNTKRHKNKYKIPMQLKIVLLRLSKSAPKLQFFSNVEPYQNHSFGFSIDSFGFMISKWPNSRQDRER